MTPIFSVSGKHILVTGASSGMGKIISSFVASHGGRVSLLARNEERLHQVLASLEGNGHDAFICDLTDEDQIKSTVASIQPLDGIVLCAGINEYVPVKFIKQEKFDKLFQTNYFSQIILIQQLLKKKLINKGASIVAISSISSLIGTPGTLIYASSKGALNSSIKVLASELAPQRIRVNAICPGIVKTEMLSGTNITEETFSKQESLYPLGLGTSEDVASAVIYLLSDSSRWLTGQCMVLDGGYSLNK